jgi:hypothetical protein
MNIWNNSLHVNDLSGSLDLAAMVSLVVLPVIQNFRQGVTARKPIHQGPKEPLRPQTAF